MSKKVLVVLSGCGVFDGSEIHEAVITLLALSRAGAKTTCAAPNKDQMHVIDHNTGEVMEETRNVMVESARISRGNILALSEVDHRSFDAVFLPGGFGAAKNLCTFATEGPSCTIDPELKRVLQGFHGASKPIGAVCIAPAVIVRALGDVTVTIGADPDTSAAITAMGGTHIQRTVTQCHVDQANKVVTAPAYMCDAPLSQIAMGIDAAVEALLRLA
jgi:enhancing lycopene biosynthesis protein 2